jgi:hypothetical protein
MSLRRVSRLRSAWRLVSLGVVSLGVVSLGVVSLGVVSLGVVSVAMRPSVPGN